MVTVFKSIAGSTPETRYRQYREYESAFWEWVTEIIYAEGLIGDAARKYVYQVGLALLQAGTMVGRTCGA